MLSNVDKARLLSEALPYIQKYNKKTVVIKYGGSAMLEDTLRRAVISDIVLLSLVGIRVVVVHGGGPEINEMLAKIGKEPRFIGGLRHTDEETMEVVQMVLCGKVNKALTQLIGELGGRALGLSGLDGRLLTARQLDEDHGLVGELESIDPAPLITALDHGYIPVVSTVAGGAAPGSVYNINADTAAARLAARLAAEKLILLTDVRGLMRVPGDEDTLIPMVTLSEVPPLLKSGAVRGGMIPKVSCCVEALRAGVRRTHILDGRIPHSILIEMLSDEGVGTMILK
ncbi:MAG: acetylglutamate kinase [Oscillospiraceae bacterium]|jgi:acetylglutamate kinase|nr:acetylglutamate kinase [Oscillospiraceae bacterium]